MDSGYYTVLSELNVSDGAAEVTTEPKMEAFHPHINAGMGFKQGKVGRESRLETAVKFFAKDPACLDANIAVVEHWIRQNNENQERSKEKDRKLQIQLRELEMVKKRLTGPSPSSKRCAVCNASVGAGNFARHMSLHEVRASFQCEHCLAEFTRKEHMIRHAKIHTDGRRITCAVCEYVCARKDELSAHMRKAHSS